MDKVLVVSLSLRIVSLVRTSVKLGAFFCFFFNIFFIVQLKIHYVEVYKVFTNKNKTNTKTKKPTPPIMHLQPLIYSISGHLLRWEPFSNENHSPTNTLENVYTPNQPKFKPKQNSIKIKTQMGSTEKQTKFIECPCLCLSLSSSSSS